jgi:hypothetical protein
MENIVLEATDRVHTMTLKNVKPADAALYSVKAHNPAGQTSCSARLKVARKFYKTFSLFLFSLFTLQQCKGIFFYLN